MGDFAKDDARLVLLATGRDEYWQRLYEDLRSPFRLFFLKRTSASPEEVNALFQDAMVVLHRKVINGDLQAPMRSSLRTYLFGVGKMLYRKQQSQGGNQKAIGWDDDIPEISVPPVVEDQAERREQAELVRRLLAKLDKACRELLTLVYIRGFAMEAVAEELDIPSSGAARKRKFDCLNKMRKLIGA